MAEKPPPKEEADRLRRAEELREAVKGLTGGEAGNGPGRGPAARTSSWRRG